MTTKARPWIAALGARPSRVTANTTRPKLPNPWRAKPCKLYGAHFCLHAAEPAPDNSLFFPALDTAATAGLMLAFVLPKKLAKSAARRNLVRRIWRDAIAARQTALLGSNTLSLCLLVRQTKPFSLERFQSAQSNQLAQRLRQEAELLLAQLAAQTQPKALGIIPA